LHDNTIIDFEKFDKEKNNDKNDDENEENTAKNTFEV